MNNPIFNPTVKVIESMKNSKGSYSTKNEYLRKLGERALKLGIGCNFVLPLEISEVVKTYKAIDGEITKWQSMTTQAKVNEVINFFTCLSLTMADRVFTVTTNKSDNYIVVVSPLVKFPERDFFKVTDKNAVTEEVGKARNLYTSEVEEYTIKTGKGKRPINNDEISILKTCFNSVYGVGYNKEIVIVNKKEKTA
jgi:hypothetical protein